MVASRRIALAIAGGLLVVLLAAASVLHIIKARLVEAHHQAITRELRQWETEYRQVRTLSEAVHAIGMLEYVQRYYVVGPGYRSDRAAESALEDQRARTVATIVAALAEFSGEDFGADVAAWRRWHQTKVR